MTINPLRHEGIATVTRNQPDMLLVAEASNGREAVQGFRGDQPDVTPMDLRLPDMSGIEAMIAILNEFPDARPFAGDTEIQRALYAGARAYVLKSMPPSELVDVIRQVHAGKKRIPAEISELTKLMILMGWTDDADRIRAAFATSGRTGALRQYAKELEHVIAIKQVYFPGVLAQVYVSLGDKDRAFYWLLVGVEHRHMAIADPTLCEALVDPGFSSLRSDPRFASLLRRHGCAGITPDEYGPEIRKNYQPPFSALS